LFLKYFTVLLEYQVGFPYETISRPTTMSYDQQCSTSFMRANKINNNQILHLQIAPVESEIKKSDNAWVPVIYAHGVAHSTTEL